MKVKAVGIFASVLCAVHCIATPVLASALPGLIPSGHESHEMIAWGGLLITYPVLGFILIRDFKIHKSNVGFVVMLAALVMHLAIIMSGTHILALEFAHLPLIALSLILNHRALHKAHEKSSVNSVLDCSC